MASSENMALSPTANFKSVSVSIPLDSRESPPSESWSPTLESRANTLTKEELRRLLPVSFRHGKAWIGPPHKRVHHFLVDDLNIDRLTEASPYFFMLGKASPPRPLHYQRALGLEIFVAERMDTHLLWAKGKIFIKPFPRYLLERQFWTEFLECPEGCPYALHSRLLRTSGHVRNNHRFTRHDPCAHSKLWRCAMGFVYSYMALVAHESDFDIAKSKRLVPEEVEFEDWKTFISRMLGSSKIIGQIDERFLYGELDLARLNKLFMFRHPLKYLFQWNDGYGFFQDHFSLLPSLSIYMAVVLVSMQAGIAMTKLKENKALALVMYGTLMLSLVSLVAVSTLTLVQFV
ncbi:hypothetical protein V8C37DRAFT_417339 [Trichoderma ceciliae]